MERILPLAGVIVKRAALEAAGFASGVTDRYSLMIGGQVQCKPVRRRVFTILAALSLLLCISLVALWIRSYWVHDTLALRTLSGDWMRAPEEDRGGWRAYHTGPSGGRLLIRGLGSSGGVCYIVRQTHNVDADEVMMNRTLTATRLARASSTWQQDCRNLIAFRMIQTDVSPWFETAHILAPHWFLVVLSAVLPACWAAQHHRLRRRIRLGLCMRCGYDLRASNERCPECGMEKSANARPCSQPRS